MPLYRVEVGIEASCVAYVAAPSAEVADQRIAELSAISLLELPESMVLREQDPAQIATAEDLEVDAGWKNAVPFVSGGLRGMYTCLRMLTDSKPPAAPVKEG